MKKTALLLISLFLATSVFSQIKAPQNTHFQVVGYIPGYRDVSVITDSAISRLTVACYAFATIDSTGHPRIANEKQLKTFTKRAHKLGVKVMLSFNGKHAIFTRFISKDSTRKVFVDDIWKVVKKYRLDGVDNDWEFPRSTDASAEANLKMMKDFSTLCRSGKKQYLLTMAITSGTLQGNRTEALTDELFDLVDWFNVMVYGDFSETRPGRAHSTFTHLENSYNYWIKQRHMPTHKYVVGLPVYGLASGLPKKYTSASYASILRVNGTSYSTVDTAYMTSKNFPEPYIVYYNGLPTIEKKVRFTLENDLGGIMFWEVSQDTNDQFSIIKHSVELINHLQ
ncbi:MAG: glycoside hydrolase family 18 protein [Flavobacteriales bacterium]|nr:glycoside hydrolase family 18 protein [Flavobacteriales bacterium]